MLTGQHVSHHVHHLCCYCYSPVVAVSAWAWTLNAWKPQHCSALFCCVCRCQVREVLEGYLDDDQDMKDMNITAKEQHALQQEEAQVGEGPDQWHAAVTARSHSRVQAVSSGCAWRVQRMPQQQES